MTDPKRRATAEQVKRAVVLYEPVRQKSVRLIQAITELHEQGFSLRQIGEVLDISHEQVRQKLRDNPSYSDMRT